MGKKPMEHGVWRGMWVFSFSCDSVLTRDELPRLSKTGARWCGRGRPSSQLSQLPAASQPPPCPPTSSVVGFPCIDGWGGPTLPASCFSQVHTPGSPAPRLPVCAHGKVGSPGTEPSLQMSTMPMQNATMKYKVTVREVGSYLTMSHIMRSSSSDIKCPASFTTTLHTNLVSLNLPAGAGLDPILIMYSIFPNISGCRCAGQNYSEDDGAPFGSFPPFRSHVMNVAINSSGVVFRLSVANIITNTFSSSDI